MTKKRVIKVAVVKALQRINAAGAVVTIPGGLLVPAGVVWCRGDTIYWCQLFFEDQHHVHGFDASKVEIKGNSDSCRLWCTSTNGEMFDIAPDTGRREWQFERERWNRQIADPSGRQQIGEFLMDAIGDAPDGWTEPT